MTQHPRRGLAALALLLFALCLLAGPAAAESPPGGDGAEDDAATAVVTAVRQETTQTRFTAVLDFTAAPRAKLVLLRRPTRIALDLFDTVSAVAAPSLAAGSLVQGTTEGLVAADRYRILFSLGRPGLPRAEWSRVDGHPRLTLVIEAADAATFEAAPALQTVVAAASETAVSPAARAETRSRKFVIVLDPGHGGIDTGALGKAGTLEKDVNLRVALALKAALATDKRIDVVMTREDDRFISLGERSAIGRRAKADLFISLHADSIRYPAIRGATVYTLSERASDALARETAESENASDRFADSDWGQGPPEVFDILVDLTRRETDGFSDRFAAGLVGEFGRNDVRLIKNPKRSAGFRVLMAPDVPSVLVEMGYLSNADDEALLLDDSWQGGAVTAIAGAVTRYLDGRAVPGTPAAGR